MAPFRNPFTSKKPVNDQVGDENVRPLSNDGEVQSPYRPKQSLALDKKEKSKEPNEFKLSSVNDSGEYMPPSPSEENKGFWQKSQSSSTNNHRELLNDNEPFSISRESFESYRRSFDISGRSPVLHQDSFGSRASLDSRSPRVSPWTTWNGQSRELPPVRSDTEFEDVKLEDPSKQQPKKKSFLSRFSDVAGDTTPPENKDSKSHLFHIPGRKRGQSGSGNELGDMQRPTSNGKAEVAVN